VDRTRHFLGQGLEDQPLAGHPGLARKGLGLDQQVEVALAPLAVAGMAVMAVAVVDDLQPGRRKAAVSLAAMTSAIAPMTVPCLSILERK
jgi:hypothetical protein